MLVNQQKALALEFERHEETGDIVSDRKGNRDDHKRDCIRLYRLPYRRKLDVSRCSVGRRSSGGVAEHIKIVMWNFLQVEITQR